MEYGVINVSFFRKQKEDWLLHHVRFESTQS
jgi:hypothetical protein